MPEQPQPVSGEGAQAVQTSSDQLAENLAANRPDGDNNKLLEVHIVGTDEVANQARDAAERRLETELAELSRRQVISRIWKSNIGREHLLTRYAHEAEDEIRRSENLYALDEIGASDDSFHRRAMSATLDRFTSQYDELVHTEADEAKHELASDAEIALATRVKSLVGGLASGLLSPEAFNEGRTRLLSDLEQTHPELVEQGSMYADNLVVIAEQVRARVEAGEELERILAETKVYVDRAKTGVRTEVFATKVDKTLEWMKEHHLSLANEQTMTVAVSLAYTVGRWSARTAAGTVLKLAAPVGAAGVWAGLRESHRMKEERRQHSRDIAKGRDFNPDSERRVEIEQARYESRGASELLEQLYGACLEQDAASGEWRPRDFTPEQFNTALAVLAEITARRQLSDQEQIDLISFSDVKNVEIERLELDLMVARAKVGLQRHLDRGDATWQEQFVGARGTVEAAIRAQAETAVEALWVDITEKDEAFASMKRSHVAKAVAKGVLLGAGFGVVAQELTAMVRSDQTGAIESLWQDHTPEGAHQTLLRHWLHGSESVKMQPALEIAAGQTVRLPEGVELKQLEGGGYQLRENGRVLADGLKFDGGKFDEPSLEALSKLKMAVTTEKVGITSSVTESVSSGDYVTRHSSELANVRRTLWYDQNTPVYDRNELGLHWGGNAGVDGQGNYVMSTATMAEGGSWHEGLSANARELAAKGELRLQLSISEDTQDRVFSIPIDANGNAVITADSPAGRLLFRANGGQAEFLGRYAEVAQVMSRQDGIEQVRLLATHEGSGLSSIPDVVSQSSERMVTTIEMARSVPIDVPPVIPVYGRRGLEPSAERAAGSAPQASQEGGANRAETTPPTVAAAEPATQSSPAPVQPVTSPPVVTPAPSSRPAEAKLPTETGQVEVRPGQPLLSLFEVKEEARRAVARLKQSNDITPAVRRRIAANIGRVSQHMDDRKVTQTDLFSLFTALETVRQKLPGAVSESDYDLFRRSILALDGQLADQVTTGWQRGPSAPVLYPTSSGRGTAGKSKKAIKAAKSSTEARQTNVSGGAATTTTQAERPQPVAAALDGFSGRIASAESAQELAKIRAEMRERGLYRSVETKDGRGRSRFDANQPASAEVAELDQAMNEKLRSLASSAAKARKSAKAAVKKPAARKAKPGGVPSREFIAGIQADFEAFADLDQVRAEISRETMSKHLERGARGSFKAKDEYGVEILKAYRAAKKRLRGQRRKTVGGESQRRLKLAS